MTDRLKHMYGLYRCEKLVVRRTVQLYKMPAADALDMARRYIAITDGLDLRPGISVGRLPEKSGFEGWRCY